MLDRMTASQDLCADPALEHTHSAPMKVSVSYGHTILQTIAVQLCASLRYHHSFPIHHL